MTGAQPDHKTTEDGYSPSGEYPSSVGGMGPLHMMTTPIHDIVGDEFMTILHRKAVQALMDILLIYLAAINLIGYALMGFDKSRARRNKRRVPERRLFMAAAAGGALGSWIGMRVFRHKTKHKPFVIGIPFLLVLNLAIVYYLLRVWLL